MGKEHANFGVKRNKKPLQNIVYKIEVMTESDFKIGFSEETINSQKEHFEKYKFSDGTYVVFNWQYEKQLNQRPNIWNSQGFITPNDLKTKLGQTQWCKFRQGKRIFTIQRRIDGKNI